MGRRCCIAGCASTSRLPEHHGVTYHSFPLDQSTRAIWIRNTRISVERQITKSVLVCSRHFRRADFQPQRSGKYLLKQRVFPTVFPWGKMDSAQIEADMEFLSSSTGTSAPLLPAPSTSAVDEDTKATVAATVAQIMAQTAELSAATSTKSSKTNEVGEENNTADENVGSSSSPGVKFEPVTSFNSGIRLEAQDFEGIWHSARVVEVDNDDREVLIKFEKTGKTKSAIVGTEEWIPMNSTRLRQRISTKPIHTFALEEKCMARWSGPGKFPGTVKKVLPNDMYEVLFDDGYIKNVRAIHMTKASLNQNEESPVMTEGLAVIDTAAVASPSSGVALKRAAATTSSAGGGKKRSLNGPRRDWPLLDMSKLDLSSLNLPEIPRDGEWTCHWVNDQPIGREGYLIVGEHRKPTVIVEDWRLPSGWIKHMYQRSNVLGKWDVILVTPNGKRFRSKSDLKLYLEEQGQVYNPDIYDFSIHRRRAKDINCYVFTPDYVPSHPAKAKATLNTPSDGASEVKSTNENANVTKSATNVNQFLETPIAESMPPMELLTSSVASEDKNITQVDSEVPPKQLLESAEASSTPTPSTTPTVMIKEENAATTTTSENPKVDDGFGEPVIGGLKVQIIDNLFRCPQEGCSKNFRKENHLQIHVKHYHQDLNKLLGSCPKMQELAEKRTHTSEHDSSEPTPKNQIPNQQFFAKLHQQDLEQSRAHRRSMGVTKQQNETSSPTVDSKDDIIKVEDQDMKPSVSSYALDESPNQLNSTAESSLLKSSFSSATPDDTFTESGTMGISLNEPSTSKRFSPTKRTSGSRKSQRQRTTRRYLTAAQAALTSLVMASETSFGGVTDLEETRHSFNATPDHGTGATRKRKTTIVVNAPTTPLSGVDSPITADSGSAGSFAVPSSNENEGSVHTPQYIKENGELIKIVRMRQEEIINCLCGYGEEDGLMIQCELCLCWQHGLCNGIDKESLVPEKYVCYICRHPQRARESLLFKHDQDWLYEGKLPQANYHSPDPCASNKFDFLKRSHTLTGNLLELKNFMHSLRVKINTANNKYHPKLYLWAKRWDETPIKPEIKSPEHQTINDNKIQFSPVNSSTSPSKKIKLETAVPLKPMPNIPQPEAPIDPVECQQRLLEHIKVQQQLVMNRLEEIELAIDDLERNDNLEDLKETNCSATKDVLAAFIKELDTVKQIGKLNILEHRKLANKSPPPLPAGK
uniref:MBD domain-containing protein n=1 Tax=Glossina brevipalpis TaxID=37001 RepID=A0A1A9WUX7_9MUSC